MGENKNDVPRFVEKRGCINCETSKRHKEKTGKKSGFSHELMASCMLFGCQNEGFSLATQFTDPEEIIEDVKKNPELKNKAIQYCNLINERFGHYYKKIGVSIEEIIKKIESIS